MRILTHNTLRCNTKEAVEGFPLQLEVGRMEVRESPVDPEFIRHLLPSLSWNAVLVAARAVGFDDLPAELTQEMIADDDFVAAVHRLLLDVHVIEGVLICPDTGRRFPIENGIPNMMYVHYALWVCCVLHLDRC